jgi:transposase
MFYVEHHRINFIARHFGVHHSTVSRALNQDFHRTTKPPSKPRVLSDKFIEYLYQRIEQYPKIRGKKLFHEIQERGYKGSYNTAQRYIREIRPKLNRVHIPMECIAGEEAQVDWAHMGSLVIEGATRKIYCFVMTLSWSRASWVDLTMDMTSETLLRCHSKAFAYFGGVPCRVSYDNMKTVVIERLGNIIRFHKDLLEYASWYCYEPHACAPYQPQQKGRVERFIRYMRDSFFNGYTIENIEEARYQLRLWLFTANARPWPVRHEYSIEEKLLEERLRLLPLPSQLWPMGQKTVKSGKIPFIRFDLNQYSIDPNYANQALTIFYDNSEIKVMSGNITVARHKRHWGRDQVIRSESHTQALFRNTTKGQASGLFRHILQDEIPELKDVLLWCQHNDISFCRLFNTLTSLREDYGLAHLKIAIHEALADGRPTPEIIAVICRRNLSQKPIIDRPLMLPERAGVSDLTIKTHDLSGYDDI